MAESSKPQLWQWLFAAWMVVLGLIGFGFGVTGALDPNGVVYFDGVPESNIWIRGALAVAPLLFVVLGLVVLRYDPEASRKEVEGWPAVFHSKK